MALTRRRFAQGALAMAAALPIGGLGRPAVAAPGPTRLALPRPTGPYPIGMRPVRLTGGGRDLMTSVWYPVQDVRRYPIAPWIQPAALRALLGYAGFDPDTPVLAPLTAAHQGAPMLRRLGRRPAVLYSHEAHDHRADTTIIVQELASHGYVVITVDHTGDAITEFPDGRVLIPSDDPATSLGVQDFADDIRLVLDQLERLDLADAIDWQRVGMFGSSKGGTATARVMYADRRVRAGLSLDGPQDPPVNIDLDRPFLLMTAEFTRAADANVAAFWSHLRGWRLNAQATGAAHGSYGDYQVLIPQLARIVDMSDEDLRDQVGTLDPARAVRIQQAYPLAFFDLHLRGRRSRLLSGPSRAFPEVMLLP